ncbi:bifunctional folylpolyglutamate synthase/dihydrofolate synthase [Candidatus Saganbacteria bacterium]|nr:bifunctional folylpolyglutamate synthase/dihydrofolate synthase [Candidatus Saganbacteria bacterium]
MLDFDTLNINLGLERVSAVLKELGDPHVKFKSIHVAGTNGKGSVCAMLASILKESGQKVGLFTSPHLYKWNERIKVDGDEILDDNLQHQTSNIQRISKSLDLELTQFEIIVCIAFKYFAEQKIDIAIVEVGLGGRLDATNVIIPQISVITNVDFDHTEYLGKTLKDIAFEKAGIIKEGVPLVTAENKPEALDVIKSRCEMRDAKCEMVTPSVPRPFDFAQDSGHLPLTKGENERGLKGSFQRINEAVAVKVAQLLAVSREHIEAGLRKVKWPGRFQIVSNDPFIIVDGAHNPAGAKALIESLKELNINKPFTFILGFQEDKDIGSMLGIYGSFSKNIILAKSSHPQAADLPNYLPVAEAVKKARKIGNPIVVAGSLFLAAEALTTLAI